MGCGKTLFRGSGGYVTCGYLECPNPSAATDILLTEETEHIVVFDDDRFSIQHPLRERIEGELFDCGLHKHLSSLNGPPVVPGRYRATLGKPPRWHFALLT